MRAALQGYPSILSTTSFGIAVPVLKERGLMTTPYGQSLLISAVVADFGAMLLITVVAAAISRGLTLDVLLGLLLLAVFAVAVRLGHLAARLPGEVLILGLRRSGEAFVPHDDIVLQRDDILMLVGCHEELEQAMAWINPSYLRW